MLRDVGLPDEQISLESQCYDILLLGKQTYFQFETHRGPDDMLTTLLKDSPRPIVTVPEQLGRGDSIVVAYDGSLQAARTLQAFQSLRLGKDREVHVVSVADDYEKAVCRADRAVTFLGFHEITAERHAIVSSSPASSLVAEVQRFDAGLLVMGAYGQSALREFFFGSVTQTMLKGSSGAIVSLSLTITDVVEQECAAACAARILLAARSICQRGHQAPLREAILVLLGGPMTPATKKAAPTAQGRQAPPAAAGGELASLPMAELERRFDSSADGLSQAEAHERIEKYGFNELPERHVNRLVKFLSYFWGPIPWMIEGAIVLSALVRHWADFFIILVLLLANAVVGFWEEYQAGNAIEALKARLAIRARVRRDGKWTTLPRASWCPAT